MKTNTHSPSFTALTLSYQQKTSKPDAKAIEMANKLDDSANKYSDGSWKTQPPSSHYRNTFVEAQQQNYLKRLNLV